VEERFWSVDTPMDTEHDDTTAAFGTMRTSAEIVYEEDTERTPSTEDAERMSIDRRESTYVPLPLRN
jgi:hypothetical protein